MKKPILTLLAFCLLSLAFGQEKTAGCCKSATKLFANLADDERFSAQHLHPKKYTHHSRVGGKMITFPCPDGTTASGYVLLSQRQTTKWIFVFQEWWGLNDNIKKWSEDLYNEMENVNVLALDMYDGKLATDRKKAAEYMQAFKQKRGEAIIKGALAYAGETAEIGTIGWCFGGGLSLQAAITMGKQATACVMYYGMPEKNVDQLEKLHTDVLNIWATRDKWINKEVMEEFKKNMAMAGKKLVVHAYDAEHAFANPSNPVFDGKAYEDAKAKTIAYFTDKMR